MRSNDERNRIMLHSRAQCGNLPEVIIPLDAIRRMREVMRVRANEALEDNGVLFCFPTSITGRKRDVDGVLL